MPTLAELEVLVLDGQSTGATPAHGQLIEVGWHRFRAAGQPAPRPEDVGSALVALPPGVRLPRAVRELTGIKNEELAAGGTEAEAWRHLSAAASPLVGAGPAPTVIHFAQFEARFFEALHAAHGEGPYPFEVCCTHQVAQRLLPELPRRGLRALSGYFGFSPDLLRRSAGHVAATCVVWQGLVGQLAERGVETWPELLTWLATAPKPKATRRVYPMPRERRLGLPDVPGVYRFLRANGDVLYVGKATSLKKRVNSHFTKQGRLPERTLEMLSQARDLAVTPCATALEAALLEADEIKRLAPPYNVSLVESGRHTWFASRDLARVAPAPDPQFLGSRAGGAGPPLSAGLRPAARSACEFHERERPGPPGRFAARAIGGPEGGSVKFPVGPLPARYSVAAVPALVEALSGSGEDPVRAVVRALGLPPSLGPGLAPGPLLEGLAELRALHPELQGTVQSVLRLARALAARPPPPEVEREADVWDAARVREHLEEALGRVPALLARARLLRHLQDAVVEFTEPGQVEVRRLVLSAGLVREAGAASTEVWAGAATAPAEALDIAGYDRLRVLVTELKRVLRDGGWARLWLRPGRPLEGAALLSALSRA